MTQNEIFLLFAESDVNRSGLLSHKEFVKALKKLGVKLSGPQVQLILSKFDRDDDGEISRECSVALAWFLSICGVPASFSSFVAYLATPPPSPDPAVEEFLAGVREMESGEKGAGDAPRAGAAGVEQEEAMFNVEAQVSHLNMTIMEQRNEIRALKEELIKGRGRGRGRKAKGRRK